MSTGRAYLRLPVSIVPVVGPVRTVLLDKSQERLSRGRSP